MTNQSGFSIAEVIISLFVITVGIITVLGLIASSVQGSAANRNQIIGTQLAQEGFELVRNIKDNNVLSGGSAAAFNGIKDKFNQCIDINNVSLYNCDFKLKYNPSNQLYYHSAPEATPFSRKIDTKYISESGENKLQVTSAVWWNGSSTIPANCNLANRCVLVTNKLTEY